MNTRSVGRTVRWARRRAGLTQAQLAEALGVPQPTIARIERGSVVPRTATLFAILEATGHQLTVEPQPPAPDLAAIRKRMVMEPPKRTWRALPRAVRDPMTSPVRILKRLRYFNVPFVLIGDMAEMVQGSPSEIRPLVEVCHAQTDVARERLAMALDDLGPKMTGARRLRLRTATAAGDDYEVLARNADPIFVDAGIRVQVASLEDLIRARLAVGRPADLDAVAILRAIADEPWPPLRSEIEGRPPLRRRTRRSRRRP